MKLHPKLTKDTTCATIPVKPTKLVPLDTTCTAPALGYNSILQQVKSYLGSFPNISNISVLTADSITGGGFLTDDLIIQLVNDSETPGILKYYGTDVSGVKGYHTLTAIGSVQYQDEGVDLGLAVTVDTLNFTGPHITASRTGNTITVLTDTFLDAFGNPIP